MTHEETTAGVRANLTGCMKPAPITKAMIERGAGALHDSREPGRYIFGPTIRDYPTALEVSERVIRAAMGRSS